MTQLQQGGALGVGAGADALVTIQNPIGWRYLWVQCSVANQAPVNVWIGAPPANRAPDFTIAPGQQRTYDGGTVAALSLWFQSADNSAWSGAWSADVEPIAEDANTVGATTPLQPARTLATFRTTNNGVSATTPPIPIPAGMQSVLVGYPTGSAGPASVFAQGVQSGRIFPTFATQSVAPGVGAFLFVVPAGGADTSFVITHAENDGAPQTVPVDGIFTPILQGVIAAQGFGAHSDGSWDVHVIGGSIGDVVVDIGQLQNPPLPVKLPGGLLSKRFFGAIAVGGTTPLVAGVAGKIITVMSASLQLVTGATGFQLGHMESDATSQPIVSSTSYVAAGPQFAGAPVTQTWEGGMPLPAGEGIRLRTDAGSTVATDHLAIVAYTGPA